MRWVRRRKPKCIWTLLLHCGYARSRRARQTAATRYDHICRQLTKTDPMLKAHHRLLAEEQVRRSAGHGGAGARRHLRAAQHPAGRHPGPLGHAGHHLHRVAGPGAADRPGPGHLSHHHQDAVGAARQSRPRLFLLRLLLRLCDLRGRHRSLLGAQPGARIPEQPRLPVAQERHARARPGCHRRRLGLHVFDQFHQPQPGRIALHAGLVSQIPAHRRRGRVGGRVRRRLRQAIPGDGRSRPSCAPTTSPSPTSAWPFSAATAKWAAARSRWAKRNSSCASAATSRAWTT